MVCKCKLADFNVQFELDYERTANYLSDFKKEFDVPDLKIKIPPEIFELERKNAFEECKSNFHNKTLEITAAFRVLAEKLPFHNSAVFHSCAFKADGKGIALTARSGTGKTTHMMLWKEMLGEKFNIVNGDKPIIRLYDDGLYMYGSPWAGKENLYANIKARLTDICLISRSETNCVEKLSKQEGIDILMQQIYMPYDISARLKTLELITKIVEKVNFWQINCNMEPEAAEVAYNTIFGKNQ